MDEPICKGTRETDWFLQHVRITNLVHIQTSDPQFMELPTKVVLFFILPGVIIEIILVSGFRVSQIVPTQQI